MSALTFLEHTRSPRPSLLLNAFLFLTLLFDIAQTRSLWLSAQTYNERVFARVFTVATAWKAPLILLESQHKNRWLPWNQKDHSPEETTGLYGLGTFFWLNTLFISGYKKVLDISDLFSLDKNMSAESVQKTFSQKIQHGNFHGKKNGLAKTLASSLAVPFLLPMAPRIALMGLAFCQPFLLDALMNHLKKSETESPANNGYGLIGATILVYTGIPTATAFYWYFQERALFMARACLSSAVYRKTIQAKISVADDSAAVTLMSADVERIRMGFMQVHEFWANPIQVALACWLLQRQLGAAFAAPIVVVLLCAVSSTFLMRFVGPRQMAWMKRIQKRVGHTANVIGNMRHLKISGMTAPVEQAIQQLRMDELEVGGKFRSLLVATVAIGFTPVLLTPVFTFAVTSRNLDVTTIFTSISYLLLLCEPLSTLFQIAPQLLAGVACLQRVQAFLEKESRHDFRHNEVALSEKPGMHAKDGVAIKVEDGHFGWNEDTLTLENIDVSIPSGLTMVIGPVASGKSTFSKALLGETPVARGKVTMGSDFRKVGYCDQVPFLWNGTVKDNVIGFSDLDEKRYKAVIEATMLTRDLSLLPKGDQTKVGSSGITLSGGQKQRVSIARALYLHSDLLIFDDVLSGLDADTEEQVFRRVFGPAGMLKERGVTAVLCTHAIRHLPLADHIIALNEGTVTEQGVLTNLSRIKKDSILSSDDVATPVELLPSKPEPPAAQTDANKPNRVTGDSAVFAHYFRNIGAFWLIGFIFFGIVCGFFYSFPSIWLKYWSEDVSSAHSKRTTAFYIGLYALFQCLALGSLVTVAAIGMLVIIRISGSNLHKATLRSLISAPLRFFSTTDTGVVTNLFSQDMTLIDGELPQSLINTSLQTWIGIGAAAVIATSSPYILIAYPFVVALLYCIQRFYLRTSRQLRLLDLEAKSPLYTNFLDTIKGVATFRAFGWTEDAVSLNNRLLDTSQRPAYLLSMVQRWLAFVLGMVVAVIALLVVTLSTQLRSNTGFTGASMVSLMSFGKTLSSLIQMYTLLETSIGAVNRLKSFSENTESEDKPGEDVVPPTSWPEKGRIEIRGVSASYDASENPENLALRDLTLTIEAGQKVAICGRTGSGKSSTILLLLRLLDPLPSCASNMSIDGVALHTIDRSTLRQRIIAVPQDAVFLPDGTSFRLNLDPFAVATDDDCQAVLDTVGLWPFVSDRGGLAADMTADSLSQGQKQLFSLARAILRRRIRSRELSATVGEAYLAPSDSGGVLILDEVSSSVDAETNKTMQEIIQREFKEYTILMISHKLEMVMDFDQVVVMDEGRVVEQGVPRELVKMEGSRFRDLWATENKE
ncbi:ABC transporter FGM5 [Cladobotryum mycophilum]|uniref:ABC transporter FGM5 n=1 Tax=Cladobotryum mycophilum TaxID=491253 RepID=A0ABR0SGQ3_9HYPO